MRLWGTGVPIYYLSSIKLQELIHCFWKNVSIDLSCIELLDSFLDLSTPYISSKESEILSNSYFLPPVFRRNGEGTVFTGVCLFTPGEGVPTLDGGGVPTLEGWGTYLGWVEGCLLWMGGGIPTLDGERGYLPWMGEGVPTLDRLCVGQYASSSCPQEDFLVYNCYDFENTNFVVASWLCWAMTALIFKAKNMSHLLLY